MTQARSIGAFIAVVDVATAGTDDSAAAAGAALSRLPDGYDLTDLRVLEWIAVQRRRRGAPVSGLAA